MDETLYTAYLEGSLRLSQRGEWFHEGRPFTNDKVKALFHRSIQWNEAEQRYYVVIGKGRATFECEDTAYFVLSVDTDPSPWRIILADGSSENLRPETLWVGAQDQFYCRVKGSHPARFSRTAHQTLLEFAVDDSSLKIDGTVVSLGSGER